MWQGEISLASREHFTPQLRATCTGMFKQPWTSSKLGNASIGQLKPEHWAYLAPTRTKFSGDSNEAWH